MSSDLVITDDSKRFSFTIAPRVEEGKNTGKLFLSQTRPWEPVDGADPWRVAVHPWNAGLAPSRINANVTMGGDLRNRPSMSYAKGNLDASYEGFATFPPAYEVLAGPVLESGFYNTPNQLYYNGSMYGGGTFVGAAAGVSNISVAVRNFNGKAYFAGGQFLFSVNQDLEMEVVNDFGAGSTIYDIEPFNNKLVLAMGETEPIWEMDTNEVFTQPGSACAIALGRTNELLWRARLKNRISNCIEDPGIEGSWVPVAGAEYTAGDETYSITDLKEWAGAIAAIRPDGVFLADSETNFHNQTPDLQVYPDLDNGKGSSTGWGFFWVPSIVGLVRMSVGEAPVVGPELAQRPGYRMRVRAVVPWKTDLYLVCNDEEHIADTFICKMMRDPSGNSKWPYIYHEWRRLDTTDPGYVIIVYTGGVNPALISGRGNDLAAVILGRGAGPDIDDNNYPYGPVMELEPGLIVASQDLGISIDLTGVKVVGKQVADGTITIQHDMDNKGTWVDLKSTVDGPGVVPIQSKGWFTETRYAKPNTEGRALYLRSFATMPEGHLGEDRTEIYEMWAFGNSHPDMTETITLDIYSDIKSRVRGLIQGRKRDRNNYRLLREWCREKRILEFKIPGYDDDQTIRGVILEVTNQNTSVIKTGDTEVPSNVTRIVVRRVDHSGDLNG